MSCLETLHLRPFIRRVAVLVTWMYHGRLLGSVVLMGHKSLTIARTYFSECLGLLNQAQLVKFWLPYIVILGNIGSLVTLKLTVQILR